VVKIGRKATPLLGPVATQRGVLADGEGFDHLAAQQVRTIGSRSK
jgi:hypothetical protein